MRCIRGEDREVLNEVLFGTETRFQIVHKLGNVSNAQAGPMQRCIVQPTSHIPHITFPYRLGYSSWDIAAWVLLVHY